MLSIYSTKPSIFGIPLFGETTKCSKSKIFKVAELFFCLQVISNFATSLVECAPVAVLAGLLKIETLFDLDP